MTARREEKKSGKKKYLLLLLVLLLAFGTGVGGTLAWLSASSNTVTNTFTYGDINIKMTESNATGEGDLTNDTLTLVPGVNVSKDPAVVVKQGSEECWVYVTITEENWPTAGVEYAPSTNWTKLGDGAPANTYYYKSSVSASGGDTTLYVLKGGDGTNPNGQVTVTGELVKQADSSKKPSLKFVAYAIQKGKLSDGLDTAENAWNTVNVGMALNSGEFVASESWT